MVEKLVNKEDLFKKWKNGHM